jgi:hypothetical protein
VSAEKQKTAPKIVSSGPFSDFESNFQSARLPPLTLLFIGSPLLIFSLFFFASNLILHFL